MKNTMTAVPDGLQPALARVADDIAAAASQAGQKLQRFGDQDLAGAREVLEQAQAAVTGAAKAISNAADGRARSHPWQVIGAAAVAGLLVGLLLSRR